MKNCIQFREKFNKLVKEKSKFFGQEEIFYQLISFASSFSYRLFNYR